MKTVHKLILKSYAGPMVLTFFIVLFVFIMQFMWRYIDELVGKGNLLFHMTGKQAFSFYNRSTGQSVRLVLRDKPANIGKGESFAYYQQLEPQQMFDLKPTKLPLPEEARHFTSYVCDCCGETTGSNWIRIDGDKKYCIDCYRHYDRFHV